MKDKSEVNNFIGRKTKEDLNYPLTFVLLGVLKIILNIIVILILLIEILQIKLIIYLKT